jgi:hypothetical protein
LFPISKLSAKELRSALIGMVLGDSYIGFTPRGKYPRLSISHSPKQEEYADYCIELLKNIPNIKVNKKLRNKIVKNKSYPIIEIWTNNNKFLNHIYNCLYKKGIKTVTRHQLDRLTPLGLALWYMDDGSRCFRYRNNKTLISNRAIKLCTHGFSLEENQIIQQYFKEKWHH